MQDIGFSRFRVLLPLSDGGRLQPSGSLYSLN